MDLLRFTQDALDGDRYRVEISLEGDNPRRTAKAELELRLTRRDEADLRWYLEDYLQWPHELAPEIAARVERRMEERGTGLFESIFEHDAKTRRLWFAASEKLPATRVEIVSTVAEATSIPWELLREPGAEAPVALLAHSFVRAQPDAPRAARMPQEEAGPVRILLAICRPGRGEDVPFRSVATRILKGLDETARQAFDLDVLRPPTFEVLAKTLRAAKEAGKPYHVLHFDGHGAHLEIGKYLEGLAIDRHRFSPRELYPRRARPGRHGYLLFENPENEHNQRFVDGQELAALLVETGVPVLVLNACRSAYAEVKEKSGEPDAEEAAEEHQAERALRTLAQELMDSGVGGVVAMRYNVFVVTAAKFIAELYGSLARGQSLGAAVALGRKHLYDDPLREVVADPLPLQDWQVPIVYEAAPIALFPKPKDGGELEVTLGASTATAGGLDPNLPPDPDAGFYGRDETLLALDRAFDEQQIVLLHAYAGSGKTATAAEFARWYALTGGVEADAVLFTSFE
ncbi:MAG: CHAT domain-containing protein, partial [bacterium]|nr:CHAT domain-containing protein [bacterium]